ncbi:MAG: hypothetical protein ACRCW2_01985 [Cellulosilyticaceae bacterium]
MNVYDRLLELQQISHGYEKWATYREKLTDKIIHQSQGKKIGLIGAGRCSDLDLRRLNESFGEIILIDRDERAMQEAIRYYELNHSSKVHMHICDLVGIEPEAYREYANVLIDKVQKNRGKVDIEQLADIALDYLERFYHQAGHHHVELPECEQMIVVGVHSQLLSMLEWIWSVILQNIGKDEERVRYYIDQMNSGLIRKLNILLMNHCSSDIMLGCELHREGRVGVIQGAYQAIDDIKRRIETGQVTLVDQDILIWPFDEQQNISYHMLIQVIAKRRG